MMTQTMMITTQLMTAGAGMIMMLRIIVTVDVFIAVATMMIDDNER